MRALRRLVPHLRRYPLRLLAGISCIAASVFAGLFGPLIVGRAVDAFVGQASPVALLRYGLLLIAVTAIQGVFSFGQRLILVSLSRQIEYDLRNVYFGHLEMMPLSFYQRNYTGDLMARATNDLEAVRQLCGPAIMYSTSTLLTASGALFFMARIHWQLTLLSLATMPLVALATQIFGKRIHVLFGRVQEQFSTLSTRVHESLSGARVVRAHARETSEVDAFAQANSEYVRRSKQLIRWSAAFHPLLQLLVGLAFVAMLWFGGTLTWRGEISVGQFVSFNFFLSKLVWPMIAIGWVINLIQRGTASLKRIEEIIETEPEIRDGSLREAGELRGTVSMTGLDFSYPSGTEPALEGIDLTLVAGATLGIVGHTGSGKSTLLSLIPRLLDPPPGNVFIDGMDVRLLPLDLLRAAIGAVPQEAFLFSTTIAENIGFGVSDPERPAIERAAEIAGLSADIESFPLGLETVVGERGITLSGGQKQRVALARALIREPRILLLDDCLSAVDADTEERILGNLRRVFVGRTVLVVSHRISAVRAADEIIVLERGRIAERGRHADLMSERGVYADIARRQQLEEELAAV
jgi:ATP-binding cassette subfamily B protein